MEKQPNFLKSKLILGSDAKQKGGLLPVLKAIRLSLIAGSAKRKTKTGRKTIQ